MKRKHHALGLLLRKPRELRPNSCKHWEKLSHKERRRRLHIPKTRGRRKHHRGKTRAVLPILRDVVVQRIVVKRWRLVLATLGAERRLIRDFAKTMRRSHRSSCILSGWNDDKGSPELCWKLGVRGIQVGGFEARDRDAREELEFEETMARLRAKKVRGDG